VIVTGAGISKSATVGVDVSMPQLDWPGLIEHGLNYLYSDTGFPKESKCVLDEANLYRKILKGRWEDEVPTKVLIRAATFVKAELNDHKELSTWLNHAFGDLYEEHVLPQKPEMLEVLAKLHQAGARLATTNYDDFLEKHCGVQAIDPGNAREVSTFGEASKRPKGVLHVHGCYNKASGAVLDVLDYNQITGDHRMQDTLRGLLLNKTVLFIGTGAGLQDPNFSNLLEWTDKHFSGDVEKRHYVLFRNKDLTHYSALNSIPYGEDYKDLIPFLRVLAEDVPRAHQRQYGNW
jgi:hypothetical protein